MSIPLNPPSTSPEAIRSSAERSTGPLDVARAAGIRQAPVAPTVSVGPPHLTSRQHAARRRTAWRWAATVALTTLALSAVPHPVAQVVQPSGWPSAELQRALPTEVADRQHFGVPFAALTVQNGPSRRRVDWSAPATFGDGVAGALGLFALSSWRRRRRRQRRGTGITA